jgi:DNA-binding MarR family transcriptional regulator
MGQHPIQIARAVHDGYGPGERAVLGRSVFAVGNGERDRQHRRDDVGRQLEPDPDCPCDVPAVDDVVDEVEADRHGARKRCGCSELGQGEGGVEHPVRRERVEHIGGRCTIGGRRIGLHRANDGGRVPYRQVGAVAPGGRGKATVLNRHVGQQIGEIPACARCRPAQVGGCHLRDDVYRRQNGGVVEWPNIGYRMHPHIICANIRYGNVYHLRMARRPDLAAMLTPLVREMIAAELPILEAHGLSMWGYIVLLALDHSPMRSQAALAEAIGADKTRIIPTLDDLQQRGYIERRPDPDDRRVRLLALTEAGRSVKDGAQTAIQRGEERWLSVLSAADRRAFLRVLAALSGADIPAGR